MNDTPGLDSIDERLTRALRQFAALPGSERFTGVPPGGRTLESAVENLCGRKNEWMASVPAFRDVRNWVEVHWETERQTHPPAGTVSTGDKQGNQGEVPLDASTAACKMLLAAARHGAETVVKYAKEFAGHGMIEVRSFYLLKGRPVSNAKPLDDYCTLLPYREALQKVTVAPSARDLEVDDYWPPDSIDGVCVLEARSFERRGIRANEFQRHASGLLRCGPETLALILGLVWGTGFRMFGSWHDVTERVAATLPFFYTTLGKSASIQRSLFTVLGFGQRLTNRPLNDRELAELTAKYATLPEKTQRAMNLSLRRLRDSTERIELEDKAIDLSIVLEALFSKGPECIRATVSSRGSWYFSDSPLEREQINALLKNFYDDRSYIVHGNISKTPQRQRQRYENRAALISDVENVVRASLKTMISDGPPGNWEDSKDSKSIRRDPPRAEVDIPSVKSDSLSWSLKEQKEIDRALEAVWKPTVDNAPAPPPDANPIAYAGVQREQIERYKQQGIYYIIRIPALLYMAHPKWLERADEPLDDHTRYYCERDVERHFERWRKAVHEKKVHQFELQLEDAAMYLPKRFDFWRNLVSGEPERKEQ